jgi:hypothetical protein
MALGLTPGQIRILASLAVSSNTSRLTSEVKNCAPLY